MITVSNWVLNTTSPTGAVVTQSAIETRSNTTQVVTTFIRTPWPRRPDEARQTARQAALQRAREHSRRLHAQQVRAHACATPTGRLNPPRKPKPQSARHLHNLVRIRPKTTKPQRQRNHPT